MSQFYILDTNVFIQNLNKYNCGDSSIMLSIKSGIFDFITNSNTHSYSWRDSVIELEDQCKLDIKVYKTEYKLIADSFSKAKLAFKQIITLGVFSNLTAYSNPEVYHVKESALLDTLDMIISELLLNAVTKKAGFSTKKSAL